MSSKYWVAKGSKKSKKCRLSQFDIEEKIKACKIRKVLKVCSSGYTTQKFFLNVNNAANLCRRKIEAM